MSDRTPRLLPGSDGSLGRYRAARTEMDTLATGLLEQLRKVFIWEPAGPDDPRLGQLVDGIERMNQTLFALHGRLAEYADQLPPPPKRSPLDK